MKSRKIKIPEDIPEILVPVHKDEIKKISHLSHNNYALALYMLFITKLYSFIGYRGSRINIFEYDIKTARYNIGKIVTSRKEELNILSDFYDAGLISPSPRRAIELNFIDWRNGILPIFSLSSKKDFLSQIKYFCSRCGIVIYNKSKMHELCSDCYKSDLRKRNADWARQKRERLK